MTSTRSAADQGSVLAPLKSAVRLNLSAALRQRRQDHSAWTGAVNTFYDPLDPATAAQPFAAYDLLHRGGRVHYNPRRRTWILHRLSDVRAALRATEQVTSSHGVTRIRMAADLVVTTDGQEHSRLRKQVQPAFTKAALDAWQAIIDDLASELVDAAIADPGSDIVQKLTIPMPLHVIARIMGIPHSDIADFRRWSEECVRIIDFSPTPTGVINSARSIRAALALRRYFLAHLASGELKGSDTALGRLLEHNAGGDLDNNQLFYIAVLLLIAGNETTTNLLGGMFDIYARMPDEYDRLRADPELIPMAIEEHLRYASPIQNMYRYTRAPYRIGDVVIPDGSRVLLSVGAANRDPDVFHDPAVFQIDRNPRSHIAFGYGAHMCVGAPLARMEAHAILRELVRRVSRITASGPTVWSTNSSLRGPTRLPVTLHPA
jgi:cytochrome P450